MRYIVYKPTLCCGNGTALGWVVNVYGKAPWPRMRCKYCKKVVPSDGFVDVGNKEGFHISRLREFPDLSGELEGEKRDTDLKEPA